MVPWAESDDISDSVGTIGSKAQDVTSLNISTTMCRWNVLLAKILVTHICTKNKVFSIHSISFAG